MPWPASQLDERDAQPALGQRARAVLAGRAAAQHDDVVVVAHGDLCCLIVGGSASRLGTPVAPVESLANARVFAHARAFARGPRS
jgi:hypothetical protein